jgi:hypothetical protein
MLRPLVPDPVTLGVLAALALFVLAGELGMHSILLPHRKAQVPTSVISDGAQRGALQFGYEMGTGMRTHMPSNLPYLPLAAALLIAPWYGALLAGLGFGLGRAWMALGRHYSGDVEWWDRRWRANAVTLRRLLALATTSPLAALTVAHFMS